MLSNPELDRPEPEVTATLCGAPGNRVMHVRRRPGLAHPLRARLRAELLELGPATASQLAARMGESSGATSYHLRRLAAQGLVVDEPARGRGRERYWRAVGADSYAAAETPPLELAPLLGPSPFAAWPGDAGRSDELRPDEVASVDGAFECVQWFVALTREEADMLSRRFRELCQPYTVRRERNRGRTREVRLQLVVSEEAPGPLERT